MKSEFRGDSSNENSDTEVEKNRFNDIIQDENSSCWSGENAYKSVQGCLANFDHDAELLKNLNKCSDYVQNVINS